MLEQGSVSTVTVSSTAGVTDLYEARAWRPRGDSSGAATAGDVVDVAPCVVRRIRKSHLETDDNRDPAVQHSSRDGELDYHTHLGATVRRERPVPA
jgi:hypothetical protein